jgi:hypothetical protein
MKFGYTILYVDSIEGTIAFYEKAFGLKREMVVEGEFGQLATGATKLGFAAKRMLPVPALHSAPNDKPLALEIALCHRRRAGRVRQGRRRRSGIGQQAGPETLAPNCRLCAR